jgi:hypothetical protein
MSLLDILLEKNRNRPLRPDGYAVAGEKVYQYYKQIESAVKSDPLKDYFLHYSDADKIGYNPRAEYSTTPLGVYGYPLNEYINNKKITALDNENKYIDLSQVPFAANRKYVYVFKIKEGANVIIMQNEYDIKEVLEYLEILKRKNKRIYDDVIILDDPEGVQRYIKAKYTSGTDKMKGYQIYNMVYIDGIGVTGNTAKVSKVFLDMGIDGFLDLRTGYIHINEPYQIVMLNTAFVQVVDKLQNQNAKNYKYDIERKKSGTTMEAYTNQLRTMAFDLMKEHGISSAEMRGKKLFLSSLDKYYISSGFLNDQAQDFEKGLSVHLHRHILQLNKESKQWFTDNIFVQRILIRNEYLTFVYDFLEYSKNNVFLSGIDLFVDSKFVSDNDSVLNIIRFIENNSFYSKKNWDSPFILTVVWDKAPRDENDAEAIKVNKYLGIIETALQNKGIEFKLVQK